MGGIAYFLLTGQPPFVSSDSMAVMVAHARDPVVPPSRLRDDIPADLEKVVLRCLEKNPEHRFPDAESLARALAACQDAAGLVRRAGRGMVAGERAAGCAVEADGRGDPTPRYRPCRPHAGRQTRPPRSAASEIEAVVEPVSSGGIDLSLSLGRG